MWAPAPEVLRAVSAASTPMVASLAVSTSTSATPAFIGSASASPVIDISPPRAWTMKS